MRCTSGINSPLPNLHVEELYKGDEGPVMDEVLGENGPVVVPRQVLDQLEEIRDSGYTNMLDGITVILLAEALSLDALAEWARRFPRSYVHGIFRGFKAEEEVDGQRDT